MNFLKANLLSFVSLLVMILMSILLYEDLPAQLPTDFDMDGVPQGTMSKSLAVVLLPAIFLGLIASINFLAHISPQKFSMQNSRRALDIFIFGTGIMLCFLHYALLNNNGSFDVFVRYLSYGLAAFLIIVGNVFGKTERNFFIGLRLPWTINSISNWKVTHRLAGQLAVVCGMVLLVTNTIYSNLGITLALTLAPLVIAAIYSIYYYFKYERELEE